MKSKLTREFFIPANFIRKVEGADCVVYVIEEGARPLAKAFIGTKAKPAWYFRFTSLEAMETRIAELLEGMAKIAAEKAERKANLAAFDARTLWKVGDVTVNSWGYDQTNVNAYVVVKVTKKFLTVREVKTTKLNNSDATSMSCNVVPLVTEATDKDKLITRGVSANGVNFEYGYGDKWDGKREYYCSWYA